VKKFEGQGSTLVEKFENGLHNKAFVIQLMIDEEGRDKLTAIKKL